MKNLFYILILILSLGCNIVYPNNMNLIKGKGIVTGKVQNFTDSSKVLRFSAYSIIKDIEQIAILDSSGNFRAEIELFNPQDVSLFYENSFITLFLHPGDSLYLNIDADLLKNDTYPNYDISGNNITTSKNIRDYFKSHTSFIHDPKFNPDYDKPINEFYNNLRMHLTVEDSVLYEFSKKNKTAEEFMIWAKNDILYLSFNILMSYFMYNDMKQNDYKIEIFNTDLFPCDDSSAIINSYYAWFLSQYPVMKYSIADSIVRQLLQKNDIQNSYTRTFDNLIKNEKPGLSRDIMIYKTFDMFLGERGLKCSFEDVTTFLEKYKTYISNHELIFKLEEKVSNFIHPGKETISDLKSRAKAETIAVFWEMLGTKYRDKVIYIDIWATWCGPCRRELPYSVDLCNYYKNKPFAFVTICSSSNRKEWEKAITNISQMSDNYFFNEDDSKLLGDELKIKGFPTHLVINKKGELINKNVPGLSSGDKLKDMMNKLLEE